MIRQIYRGRVIDLNIEEVELPDGRDVTLEIIRHPGGACVLPLHDNGDVTLIRQFRHAAGGIIWEVPAGRINDGEDPETCARRELKEEAGLAAGKIFKIGEFYTTPAFCTELLHIYLASQLHPCDQELEDDEFLEVIRIPFQEALNKALQGEIKDGKTMVAILLTRRWMER